MEALNTRARATDVQIVRDVPNLQSLALGMDRLLARREGASGEVSAWLTQRWSISATMANSSSPGPAHMDGDAVAVGFRRYRGEPESFIGAARELRQQEAPAPESKLAGMLATMGAALMPSRDGENETRLRLAVYVDRLRDWPADVVAKVLNEWPDRSKFWPAWAELRPHLETAARPRRSLIADLETAAATLDPSRKATLPAFALKRI